MALLIALLVLAFVALLRTVAPIVLGGPTEQVVAAPAARASLVALTPLVAGIAALTVLGLWIPGALNTLILHSIRAIT